MRWETLPNREPSFSSALRSLADHPLVSGVRGGTGFMGALELDPERVTAEPTTSWLASKAIREHGVFIRAMPSALGFSPPLIATAERVEMIVDSPPGPPRPRRLRERACRLRADARRSWLVQGSGACACRRA